MMTDLQKDIDTQDPIEAIIEFSYFTSESSSDVSWYCHDTEITTHDKNSMVFKSHSHIRPGSRICISVRNIHGSAMNLKGERREPGLIEGIPVLRVAVVKSCRQLPDSDPYSFGIEVKYKEPCY